jgi:aminomethyltransferase
METTAQPAAALRHTPLYESHIALGARMVEFAGWAMPVMYKSILEESRAVRQSMGIFDISHMGRIRVYGDGATTLLQKLTSNDVKALNATHAQYSLLTNPDGGIIDDIIVYREAEESYLVVINAGNTARDLTWIRTHLPEAVAIEDLTVETAMIAVQGPAAPAAVAALAADPTILQMKRFQYGVGELAGIRATFCRTGYTGEDGFELIVPATSAAQIWKALLERGAAPCGLGARDALRIEAGYPLYGHEIDDTTSPVAAGLMWAVKLEKGAFIGSDAIEAVKRGGPARRLVGLTSTDRIQPRQGYTICVGDTEVGVVTSGVFSPTRGHSVAMGYVDAAYAKTGATVSILVRDKRCEARIVPKKQLLEA